MGKLVILKIVDGSFDRGFTVMLQVGEEGARPLIETTGKLPPLPEMPLYYSRWQDSYRRLDSRYRISAKPGQKPNVSLVADCTQAATILKARLNVWLQAEEFRRVRENWLERLSPDEEIRIVLQTEDSQLRQLPWNLLDFLDRYPKAEFALSALNADATAELRSPSKSHVHILSVLGNSQGIDTQADRALLETLPQADVTTLLEPDRKHLTDELWRQPWDILFFAGHSSSHGCKETGRIFLNQTDSLSLSELKYALRRSVENGLKLAIFNSCDGLGLARELADLGIPQMIVMREPVPDLVAQEFLKSFLTAYAHGVSLYLAVREARERLQGLEHRFPCATWLPLICQHPAALPPAWRDLIEPVPLPIKIPAKRKLAIALLSSLVVTGLVSGARFGGLMQPLELAAYDQMLRSRPPEPPDPRMLIVTIDDNDLKQQRQQEDLQGVSISERNLSKLLALLSQHQPSAIGLDVYRDFSAKTNELVAQLKGSPNLLAICKAAYGGAEGIKPPPEIAPLGDRVGFSDFTLDTDEALRRHLLVMNSTWEGDACQTYSAFSTMLALRYLRHHLATGQTEADPAQNQSFTVELQKNPTALIKVPHGYYQPSNWELGRTIFPNLQPHAGGYQGIDTRGNQVLLNYRAAKKLADIAPQRSLRWFLSAANPPNTQELDRLIRDKVVLIGVTAREKNDYFKTPYGAAPSDQTAGVFIHAHMLSQILSAVLDGRPLLWTWSPWVDLIWVGSWSTIGGMLAWLLCLHSPTRKELLPRLTLAVGVSAGVLYGACASVFILLAGWLPLVPAAIALGITSAGTAGLICHFSRSSNLSHLR